MVDEEVQYSQVGKSVHNAKYHQLEQNAIISLERKVFQNFQNKYNAAIMIPNNFDIRSYPKVLTENRRWHTFPNYEGDLHSVNDAAKASCK